MARTQGSHSEITGPRIKTAALSLFAKHGFAAVSMRQIAAEVGVQAGALYNYIPDKQALLFSLMKEHMDDVMASGPRHDPAGDSVEQLREFVHFHISFHLDRPEAIFISYMELRNLTPENFAVIEEMRRSYENRLEQVLSQGCAQGVFDIADTKLGTLAVIAMLNGVTTWFREEGRLSATQVKDIYWQMVRKSVLSGQA